MCATAQLVPVLMGGGVPCGPGIRHDAIPITAKGASRFVPNCFDPPGKDVS